MRSIGHRQDPPIAARASGELLGEGARFSESMARLSRAAHVPKGVYRFASHEQANQHEQDCLVRAIARLALERKHG